MENDNQLKKIDVENFKEDSISEFTKNDFRKFGTKNIEKNMYYFYTDTSVNEVEADTVYDAINKVDIKNVTKIINLKTAALFSAATKTGACLAGSSEKEKEALESYGKNIGLAFQIADDALDYYSKEIIFGKKIGKDFFEGKVTLPLIIIFQRSNNEERKFLLEILKKETRTEEDFSETLALVNKYKAVKDSLQRAEYFVNVSRDALGIFPNSPEKKILQNLTDFSLNRSF